MLFFSDRLRLARFIKGYCILNGIDYSDVLGVVSVCCVLNLINYEKAYDLLEEEDNDSTNN